MLPSSAQGDLRALPWIFNHPGSVVEPEDAGLVVREHQGQSGGVGRSQSHTVNT